MLAASTTLPVGYVARPQVARRTGAPWPVLILLAAFLSPTELSLVVADLRLPPHRLVLLALVPFAVWRMMVSPSIKIRNFDVAFALFNLSGIAIFMAHEGQKTGFIYGGSLALEGLGGYLVARAYVRDIATMRAVLRAFFVCIVIVGLIALPETLFGKLFVHDTLRSLTGIDVPTGIEQRLGLTRAYGVFDHPIHLGTFCAAMLGMIWYGTNSTKRRAKRTAILVGATFLSLSSAPMLCLVAQFALIIWEKLSRGIAMRTTLTVAAVTGLYVGISLVMARSPMYFIATSLTLDSWTGFYRMQIWEHGLNSVWNHSLYGIGLSDWVRPWWMVSSTVDAYWLVVAMRQGVPSFLCLVLAIALLMRAVVVRGIRQPDIEKRRLARGWMITLIALILVGATVHFWNVLFSFLFFFFGLGGWLADPKRVRAPHRHGTSMRTPRSRQRTHHTRSQRPLAAPAGSLPAAI